MILKSKKGTTLIELIIALLIMSLIFIPIVSIFLTMNSTFYATGKLSIAQAYSNLAVSIIRHELTSADTANLTNTLGSTSGKKYLYESGGVIYVRTVGNTVVDKDVLRKPDLDGEGLKCTLIFTSKGDKSITVSITIKSKTTDETIFQASTNVYMQNTPYGVTVPVAGVETVASVAEYTVPSFS